MTTKDRLTRKISHDIGIDLGTANTLVHVKGVGIVINEPSVVAVHKNSHKVIAIGHEAKAMIGKTPADIVAARPLVDGVVSDFEITEQMLKHFLDKVHKKHRVLWNRPRVVIGLPSDVTEVEQRAVEEAATSAGARQTYLIQEPMAAAIGSGLDVLGSDGTMIIDIGGGSTEIAMMALGDVVATRSVRVAGDEFSEAIMRLARDEYNLQIGETTAENVKVKVGSVYHEKENRELVIRGRNILSGLPQQITIDSDSVRPILTRQLQPVVDAVRSALEEAPAELVSDIQASGITIAGGGGLIGGLADLIEHETRVKTTVSDIALTAVVQGCAIALDQLDAYEKVLIQIDEL